MAALLNKTVADLTVAELLQLLQSHAASAVPSVSAAKPSVVKPKKEVSAGVAAWNELVTETWEEMKAEAWSHPETGKPASRKDAMAEASKRKAEGNPEAAAASVARRAKRDEQLAKKEASPARASVPVPAPVAPAAEKAKKVLSPEHKAKMLAGAAAAREAKKAAASVPAPVAAAPPSAPAEAAAADAEAEEEEWIRKSISGKKHLWNPANNHCYRCEEDGSQGEWAGLYDPKKQKIDDSVAEPEDLPLCQDCGKMSVTGPKMKYCEACK